MKGNNIMYDQFYIIELAKILLKRYKTFLTGIDRKLPMMPSGTLQVWDSGNTIRYYHNTMQNGKRTRVPIDIAWQGAGQIISNLTAKAVLKKARKPLENNVDALESFLNEFQPYDPVERVGNLNKSYHVAEIKKLRDLSMIFMPGDIDPAAWKKEKYKKNPFHQERLKFATKAGEKVRSKSEAFIYDELTARGAEFRYECELELVKKNAAGCAVMQKVVYPDFMILREEDRRVIIHEHFGKMDDPEYSSAAMRKMDDYIAAGYHVGTDLFISWETLDTPFTSAGAIGAVEKYI